MCSAYNNSPLIQLCVKQIVGLSIICMEKIISNYSFVLYYSTFLKT